MLDDIQRSIRLVLHERITSPFCGAFFFSWFVWNWRIPYRLFFDGANHSAETSIRYVATHYLNWWSNLALPLASAVLLVTVYPFVTTGALWIWLRFKKWQTIIRNRIEGGQLLTIEQSIALRMELGRQTVEFERLYSEKDKELSL